MLGEDFGGVLITDFYAGYNDTPGGQHQRCWVHLLRDLHHLKADHATNQEVIDWAVAVKEVYLRAKQTTGPPAQRQQAVTALLADLTRLGAQFAQVTGHALAQRLLRHQGELLLFVLDPAIASDNNRAEQVVRPLVITRKVSGGSRSPQGSATRMILTWMAKGCNPLLEFPRLFQSPFPHSELIPCITLLIIATYHDRISLQGSYCPVLCRWRSAMP